MEECLGANGAIWYVFASCCPTQAQGQITEAKEACEKAGITLVDFQVFSRDTPTKEALFAAKELFETIEYPALMHCKSGADRSGFASAIYLIEVEGKPVSEARKMLAPRFMHFRNGKVGILDYTLDVYEARNARDPIGFEDWIATEYDNEAMIRAFRAKEPPE